MAVREFLSWKTGLVMAGLVLLQVGTMDAASAAPELLGQLFGSLLGAFLLTYGVWWFEYKWRKRQKVSCEGCQTTVNATEADYCPSCGTSI